MPARIVLVRHGPSAHTFSGTAIDRVGVERWREAYDAAGIDPRALPPAALAGMAARCTCVLASDLPRAVTSAERLDPDRAIQTTALLRETRLPIPLWPTRLPLAAWELLIHLSWVYRIARGRHPEALEKERAVAAARWLDSLATADTSALVVTHGVFRRLLAQQLRDLGWRGAERHGGYAHWSAWAFVAPAERG